MATYKEIQDYIKGRYGYIPKTCWIADIKNDLGMTTRTAPNRISEKRKYPCPLERRDDIIEAIKFLK
jgi:hypothetical protein